MEIGTYASLRSLETSSLACSRLVKSLALSHSSTRSPLAPRSGKNSLALIEDAAPIFAIIQYILE